MDLVYVPDGPLLLDGNRGRQPKLKVHTGGIDGVWKRVKRKLNGLLGKRLRQWQWQNANRTKDMLHLTGKALHSAAFYLKTSCLLALSSLVKKIKNSVTGPHEISFAKTNMGSAKPPRTDVYGQIIATKPPGGHPK